MQINFNTYSKEKTTEISQISTDFFCLFLKFVESSEICFSFNNWI